MHETQPEVFLLAHTMVNTEGLDAYLASLEVETKDWDYNHSSRPRRLSNPEPVSDPELLTEVASCSCYMSFGTGINRNLTQVREGNEAHLKNILDSGHGSVMEHASVTFAFRNVSRVFTHELVRHRAGCAISQESLRYVRADDLGFWMPEAFRGKEGDVAEQIFSKLFSEAEWQYQQLLAYAASKEGVETFEELPMDLKKKYTSATRRVIPIGMSTNIIWTANMRALRHVIEMRTHKSAEEEIRLVFQDVAVIAMEAWPNLFQDMKYNSSGEYWFENKKI